MCLLRLLASIYASSHWSHLCSFHLVIRWWNGTRCGPTNKPQSLQPPDQFQFKCGQKVLEIVGHAAKSLEIIPFSLLFPSCPHFFTCFQGNLDQKQQLFWWLHLEIRVFVESSGQIWNRTVGFYFKLSESEFWWTFGWLNCLTDQCCFGSTWPICQVEVVVVFCLYQAGVIWGRGYCSEPISSQSYITMDCGTWGPE